PRTVVIGTRRVSHRHSHRSFCAISALAAPGALHSSPTRRSSDLHSAQGPVGLAAAVAVTEFLTSSKTPGTVTELRHGDGRREPRSEEHTSELQSLRHLVCRLLLEKKKKNIQTHM